MDNGFFNRRNKIVLSLAILGAILVFNYSNCAPVAFKNATPDSSSGTPTGTQNLAGTIPVGATGSNPPLDLFFIVDNSASMYANQVKLGTSFTNIFQSNQASLSNFNVNVYLFSTASTVAAASLSEVATRSPASVTSVPAYSDLTDLLATPGSVFAYWNNSTGTYGTAPFSEQFNPAPVLALESGNYNQALSLPQQGSQTASQYQASINALSTNFQNRLNYLNPSNQFQSGSDPASPITDISSGLCSIARILKHSSSYITPGDAAAFVIVSDDDDRLNDRNPNNNQCLENLIASNELINGSCGHYGSTFNYDSNSSITYQSSTKFTYNSGTKISYSYPSSETCVVQYTSGYNYSWTYTAINTIVTYTKCTETADGFCVNSVPNSTLTVAGDYVGTGGTCLSTVNSLVPNVAPGTNLTCASDNVPNTAGPGGVDNNSNGSQCSSQTIASLSGQANKTFGTCTITGSATSSKSLTGQSLTNPCSTACNGLSGCKVTSSTAVTASGSISIPGSPGLTCSSQCPSGDSGVCGTGLISSYISGLQSGATCVSPSNITSSITVPSGVDSSGNQLTCSSSCPAGDSATCGTGTISSYISGLQSGATCTAAGSNSTMTAPFNMSCSTPCSSSSGFCADPYTTVAQFIASKNGYCLSASNGGPQSLPVTFKPAFAQSASCTSLCSNTVAGSCGSSGFGATDGSTIAQYITSLGGGVCTSSVAQVLSGSSLVAQNSNPTASCTDANNPVFFASGAAYAGTATNYTAGDVNHTAAEFQSAIVSQSSSVFGANPPAVALIGHLQGDVMPGASAGVTDVGTDYINLAQAMGSKEISSVTATDYSAALGSISSFIVQKSQNSFALGLPSGSTVFAVSVEHAGSQTWTPVSSSLWTWTGSTLSVNPSAGLVQGDTLMYQYNE
jgi:hypothetical protein